MRVLAAGLSLTAILLFGALAAGGRPAVIVSAPLSAMAVLEDYRCHPAETRRLVVRGVEDNYRAAGEENARLHPRLDPETFDVPHWRLARYDEAQGDAMFVDYLESPSDIASGLLVIRMRPIGDNANDEIRIGDLKSFVKPAARRSVYRATMDQIEKNEAWRRAGDVYSASLEDLDMHDGRALIDLVRESEPDAAPIDILIADDTAVDVIGLAVCERPERKLGVTLRAFESMAIPERKVVSFACYMAGAPSPQCNAYRGDNPCTESLPLLCYRDLDAPAPDVAGAAAIPRDWSGISVDWSGGEIAVTTPVVGAGFATIGDADAHCATTFGAGWRVADWHLSAEGFQIMGYVDDPAKFTGDRSRAWIDIKDQPYATCWRRS